VDLPWQGIECTALLRACTKLPLFSVCHKGILAPRGGPPSAPRVCVAREAKRSAGRFLTHKMVRLIAASAAPRAVASLPARCAQALITHSRGCSVAAQMVPWQCTHQSPDASAPFSPAACCALEPGRDSAACTGRSHDPARRAVHSPTRRETRSWLWTSARLRRCAQLGYFRSPSTRTARAWRVCSTL